MNAITLYSKNDTLVVNATEIIAIRTRPDGETVVARATIDQRTATALADCLLKITANSTPVEERIPAEGAIAVCTDGDLRSLKITQNIVDELGAARTEEISVLLHEADIYFKLVPFLSILPATQAGTR